jgi:hypothetical protein
MHPSALLPRLAATVALVLGYATFASAADQPSAEAPPEGFVALFNGKDLSGWRGMPHFDPRKLEAMSDEERSKYFADNQADLEAHWTVDGDAVVNDGQGVYLTTEKSFGDIEFHIDYKTVPTADSGIYLRTTPQVQIWDYTDKEKWKIGADKGSGGLWNNSEGAPGKDPLVLADHALGEWNHFRILQTGARTSVWLNDKLVVDHAIMENYWDRALPLFAKGAIQLQTHGGEIRWRNIFLREIEPAEANAVLSRHGEDEFTTLFNGENLDSWAGAVDEYEIRDGAIVCKPGKGGNLFTAEEYADFVARLEFKLPEGGNNGLTIRYPGTGHASYDAMCELQILDTEHPMYASIDARQAHGSAYGMVAAHRGYLRPTGEWNFQEVTVKGPKIKVELNGTVILDADLSTVTEFMGNTPHPGKDRTQGHFGFAGHGDAVEFRNVRIKRL